MNRKEKIKGMFKMFYYLFEIVKRDIPIVEWFYIAKNKHYNKKQKVSIITSYIFTLVLSFGLTLLFFKTFIILEGIGFLITGLSLYPMTKAYIELLDSITPLPDNIKYGVYIANYKTILYWFIGTGLALMILF